MLMFIYGTDHYRVREKLNELQAGFVQKRDKAGLNLIILNAEKTEKFDFDLFRQEVLATPFLGEKKMVVIKNLLANAGREIKILNQIAEFLKKETIGAAKDAGRPENIVCFADFFSPEKTKLDRQQHITLANPLFKLLTKEKFVWQFNELDGRGLNNWWQEFVRQKSIKIAPAASRDLILAVGNDLTALTMEAKKLAAYKNGETIAPEDVHLLVKTKFDDNIFNLIDAISQKNRPQALKLLSGQLQAGSAPLMILAMIQRQFKILWQIKNRAQSAAEIGVHPFVFQKALAQSRGFTAEQLRRLLNQLLKMEVALKTGGPGAKNPELLFDLLVAEMV